MGNTTTIPHVQDRAAVLAPLGWTGREADWIALVCLHSGVFTRSQYGFYVQAGEDRSRAWRFARSLLDRGVAVEDARAIFPGGARAVHITQKAIYRALKIADVRHRAREAKIQVLMRRLLSLDYVIQRPTRSPRTNYAAAARISVSIRSKPGSGAWQRVRYVSRKGSQPF